MHPIDTTLALALTVAALAGLATPAAEAQTLTATLDFATADTIRDRCLAHAGRAGVTVAVAVFDQGGNLVSFARDRTTPAAAEMALWKGRSAAIYLASTRETGTWNMATAPLVATVEGGVPLFTRDGVGIGGVGVSGAPPEFDAECGAAGAEAAGLRVTPP
jgi:glc operon protein GlcG